MLTNTLEELRNFERQKEKELKKIRASSLDEVGKARMDVSRKLKEEKERLESVKKDEIKKTELKTREEAKEIIVEYKKKAEQLENKSSKNIEKAVDKIFHVVLKKNV